MANQEPEQKADTTLSPLEPSGYSLSVTAPHPKHSYHPVRWAVIKYILEGFCTIVRRTLIIREILWAIWKLVSEVLHLNYFVFTVIFQWQPCLELSIPNAQGCFLKIWISQLHPESTSLEYVVWGWSQGICIFTSSKGTPAGFGNHWTRGSELGLNSDHFFQSMPHSQWTLILDKALGLSDLWAFSFVKYGWNDSTCFLGLLKDSEGRCSLTDCSLVLTDTQHCSYWEESICGVAKGVLDFYSKASCLSPGWAAC